MGVQKRNFTVDCFCAARHPRCVLSLVFQCSLSCVACAPHTSSRGGTKNRAICGLDPKPRVRPVALVTRINNIALANFLLLLQLRSSPRGRCPVARLQICVVRSHPDRRSISRSSVRPRERSDAKSPGAQEHVRAFTTGAGRGVHVVGRHVKPRFPTELRLA